MRFHFLRHNCGDISQAELDQLFVDVMYSDDLQIVHLDEVHRLARRHMDEQLLSLMDLRPAIWISSSAKIREHDSDGRTLEKMFQNRHSFRIETQKPSESELTVWLAERCDQFNIRCSDDAILRRLSQRSQRIPGMALQVLNKAHKQRTPVVTLDAVDSFVFDFDVSV
ncbi:MAG: hypothetical protein ABGZ35_10860 [Planctomycetaceae bacterium]